MGRGDSEEGANEATWLSPPWGGVRLRVPCWRLRKSFLVSGIWEAATCGRILSYSLQIRERRRGLAPQTALSAVSYLSGARHGHIPP